MQHAIGPQPAVLHVADHGGARHQRDEVGPGTHQPPARAGAQHQQQHDPQQRRPQFMHGRGDVLAQYAQHGGWRVARRSMHQRMEGGVQRFQRARHRSAGQCLARSGQIARQAAVAFERMHGFGRAGAATAQVGQRLSQLLPQRRTLQQPGAGGARVAHCVAPPASRLRSCVRNAVSPSSAAGCAPRAQQHGARECRAARGLEFIPAAQQVLRDVDQHRVVRGVARYIGQCIERGQRALVILHQQRAGGHVADAHGVARHQRDGEAHHVESRQRIEQPEHIADQHRADRRRAAVTRHQPHASHALAGRAARAWRSRAPGGTACKAGWRTGITTSRAAPVVSPTLKGEAGHHDGR